MAQTFLGQKRLRKYYGKIREVLEMPNLIEVQKSSYFNPSFRSRTSMKLPFWSS